MLSSWKYIKTIKHLIKKLNDNIFYLILWNIEIKKERKAEDEGKIDCYLKQWYLKETGIPLNIENPTTLTEKQQWIKLHGINELITSCSDKYKVRSYVKEKIGEQYLIPIITVSNYNSFENVEQIDFEKLPPKFVIQCNHGAHMTHVITNKSKLTYFRKKWLLYRINQEMKINYAYTHGFEFNYRNIVPRIFITECLDTDLLCDYKFMCFNGEVEYMWVDQNRYNHHKRTVFLNNFEKAPFQLGYEDIDLELDIEKCKEMRNLSEILAKDFDLVRVDFYLINKTIYFGEMTFTSSSGKRLPNPQKWNSILGEKLKISGLQK
jgi:hypothetical protein